MDDLSIRVLRLGSKGLYCSQIMVCLALETMGRKNPELIRAAAGLAFGCGDGRGSCGVLTGGACVLGLYAGKAPGLGEEESPALAPMLEEFGDWFAEEAHGQNGAVSCEAIMGDGLTRAPQPRCGELAAGSFARLVEILIANGFDPADSGKPDEY